MPVADLIRLNDWEIGRFLKAVLALMLLFFGLLGLRGLGIEVPFLLQAVGFICLTFIPGILLLRILRLHELSTLETLVYSIGLSLAFLMFFGLFINEVFPLIGIPRPLSLLPLIAAIGTAIAIMGVLSYIRDRGFARPLSINLGWLASPAALFLLLVPLLSILGACAINFYNTNIILMIMFPLIGLTAALVIFGVIPENLYPLAVFGIGTALLFQFSLSSSYLMGSDIHLEYYMYRLTEENARWDAMLLPIGYHSLLSISILPTIYASLLHIDGTWVYKVIYILIFASVPLGLYHIFRGQIGEKFAFLAVFFFMSMHTFSGLIMHMARQQIAEVFFLLLMMLILDRGMNTQKRAILLIVFSASLVVSHYTIAYLYAFVLIFLLILPIFFRGVRRLTVSAAAVALFLVITFSWYTYISGSANLRDLAITSGQVFEGIRTELFRLEARGGVVLTGLGLQAVTSQWYRLAYWLSLLTELLIGIGFLRLIFKGKSLKFSREYVALSVGGMALMFLSIALPYFNKFFTPGRTYHLTLFILAPFGILGVATVTDIVSRLPKLASLREPMFRLLLLLVLIPYFVFSTGYVYELVKDKPFSLPLAMPRAKQGSEVEKLALYNYYTPEEDVFSARWLAKNGEYGPVNPLLADNHNRMHVIQSYGGLFGDRSYNLDTTPNPKEGSYFYLGYLNVKDGLMMGPHWILGREERYYEWGFYSTHEVDYILEARNKIYSNGAGEILMVTPDFFAREAVQNQETNPPQG